MGPEAMRSCMSFGFSNKKSKSAIGQCKDVMFFIMYFFFSFHSSWLMFSITDGNGFKTSSMRLGADVIVFSRHLDNGYDLNIIFYFVALLNFYVHCCNKRSEMN